jgi:hypothetical protein
MSQTMSVTDAGYSQTGSAKAVSKGRTDPRDGRARSNRRVRRLQPVIAVPALNWPADLFADAAAMGELAGEDFPLPPHIAVALFGHQNQERHAHTSH